MDCFANQPLVPTSNARPNPAIRRATATPQPAWYIVDVARGFTFEVRGVYTPGHDGCLDEPPADSEFDWVEVRFNGVTVSGKDAKGKSHDWFEFFSQDLDDLLAAKLFAMLDGGLQ